jgi:anti-anti-sigma regulatory factor
MTDESTHAHHSVLQAIFDSPQGLVIFSLDRQYRYLAFNEAHRQTIKAIWNVDIRIGMDMLAEVVGRDDDRAKAKATFDRALAGEGFSIVDDYGDDALSRRSYESAYAPMRGADGQLVGLTCFLTDVTEKRRNEEERARLRIQLAQQNEQLSVQVQENAQLVERLRIAVSELTTPVLELWDSVLALPIVGIVDTERGGQMATRLLDALERHRARFVILDLTGVNTLDTSTASRLLQMARAAALLGTECIIAGIQSAVAQTLVAIGIDLGGLMTTRNLKQALDFCISRLRTESGTNRGGGPGNGRRI